MPIKGVKDLLGGIVDRCFELELEERDRILINAYRRIGIDEEEATKRIDDIRNHAPNQLLDYVSEINSIDEAERICELLDKEAKGYRAKIKALIDLGYPESVYDVWKEAEIERIRLAADELALLSGPYKGPRGRRPILISTRNIAKFLGAKDERELSKLKSRVSYWCKIRELIGPHSSCNIPNANPYDLKRGTQLPSGASDLDEYQAEALGIIGVFGCLTPNNHSLCITGRKQDVQFFHYVSRVMESAFNLVLSEYLMEHGECSSVIAGALRDFGPHAHPALNCVSKGLFEFLESQGVPTSLGEKYECGVPKIIRQREDLYPQYLRGVLSKGSFSNGILFLSEKSKSFLEEVRQMLRSIGITPATVQKYSNARSYRLCISNVPTRQIREQGLIIHPKQKERFEKYFG